MATKKQMVGGKYEVQGVCSNTGGMGTLYFVKVTGTTGPTYVLKVCKLADPEMLARFRREVRVMQDFNGNAYVMPILDANLDHDPPYFVMPHYEQGDLEGVAPGVRGDMDRVEHIFYRMIDCIAQLHNKDVLHRDIKPQNFLLSNGVIVVSDLGLCSEKASTTAFTRSSQWAGTPAYLPPEFISGGGFKEADAAADIFMLGKSFYAILSGRDPMYLVPDGLPPQLFPIFERCCTINKASRYQTLASLKQSLTSAFDVLLGRAVGPGKVQGLLRSISDRLRTSQQYLPDEVGEFVEELAVLGATDQHKVCMELAPEAFSVLGQSNVQQHLAKFIAVYRGMAANATYGWSFAETIANNMTVLFESPATSATDKAEALRVAIIGAVKQNRFAAMNSCSKMITSVTEPELGQRVTHILHEHDTHFIQHIEPSECQSPAVRAAVIGLKAAADAELARGKAAQDNSEIPF